MSRRTKTTTQQLYIQVSEERSNGYYHLVARVRTQKYDNLEHAYVPAAVDDEYQSGYLYAGLRLTAQGDEDSRRRPLDQEPVYGATIEYHDPYRCDRYTVQRMYKTLEHIHKSLGKICERRGYHRTYGEYCGRLAEVLGCEGIVVANKATHQGAARWIWLSIGDGVNRVNEYVRLWQGSDECPRCSRIGRGPLCKAHQDEAHEAEVRYEVKQGEDEETPTAAGEEQAS